MLQTISVLVENKPGALMRVTGLLTARGYNIDSLVVARTLDPALSRMTITVDVDEKVRAQVVKQMVKLVNVLEARDLTEEPSVIRELCLVTIRASREQQRAILKEITMFGATVVDAGTDSYALQLVGDTEKVDEFIDVMRGYGEIEVTRSGAVAVALEIQKLKLSAPVSPSGRAPASERALVGA